MATTITDNKYGEIIVRRHSLSRRLKLSVNPSGNLTVSAPLYTPTPLIKFFIKSLHKDIKQLIDEHTTSYIESGPIGKSHRLIIQQSNETSIVYKKPLIRVYVEDVRQITEPSIQKDIRSKISQALKTEAKAYLPRRIEYLASMYGFSYSKLRFSHAKSRWGSCSSQGVISLNIGLMKLDYALIDYVILHELAHTKQMNHSQAFWEIVRQCDPSFKLHRKQLKELLPHI